MDRLSRKRKRAEEDEEDDEEYKHLFGRSRKADEDNTIIFAGVLAGAVVCGKKERKKRKGNEVRISNWWHEGYLRWDEARFKQHFRINRVSFEHILSIVTPFIIKSPTNFYPNPTSPATQLALTLYRLALVK